MNYLIVCNLLINLFITYIWGLTNNIDTTFPIIFTFKKPNTSTLSNKDQQSFGSYFGHSISVNQEKDTNYVLIGAPRLQSNLYNRVERSGAVFHCFWKETDPNNEVLCTETNISKAHSPYYVQSLATNKMQLGFSLTSNGSSFIGCAPGWVISYKNYQNKKEFPPTPVGKCYVINNKGEVFNSIEPLNPRHLIKSSIFNPINKDRPLHSHMMSGFSSTFIGKGKNLVLGAPGYLDFMGSVVNEDFITNREELMDLDRQIRPGEYPTSNSYFGYSITNGFFTDMHEFIAIGAPRNDTFNGKVYIFSANERFDRIEKNNFRTIEGETLVKGEYFGATLLAIDLNNDTIDDLIVGSPFYSTQQKREIGRIYVFMAIKLENSSKFSNYDFDKRNTTIISSHQIASRFGSALSSIDVNLDDFKDVIVGAPYERSNGESSGALYIYFGSTHGINERNFKRIGAENIENVVLKGFGISIVSNTDLDNNGYNELLVGSYLSEKVVLIRTNPIAILKTSIIFEPSKIRLREKNCNNKQNFCFNVKYCVSYAGKHIREKQMAIISLNIIDSKISDREIRVKISGNNNSNEQTIELKANQRNCFPNDTSFLLILNRLEELIDYITPIEVKLSVNLFNETSGQFNKSRTYAESHTTISNIGFEYGCETDICVSNLTLTAISKYSGNIVEKDIIEGLNDKITIEINVTNSGETSLNTILIIKMKPTFLMLTNTGEGKRCKPHYNSSLYICDVNKVLLKGNKDNLYLNFIVSGITTNYIEIEFQLNSSSSLQSTSKLREDITFEIIRRAEIKISGESTKNFSYSDRTPKVTFSVSYNLMKSGPSTVRSAYLQILLPVDIIQLENESKFKCKTSIIGKNKRSTFPLSNNTLDLDCNKGSDYCTEYLCELNDFMSGIHSQPLYLSLAMIPSKIKNKVFNGINLKINSKLEIKDKVRYESKISSSESVDIYFARNEAVVVEQIELWIIILSATFGLLVLIITIILLIKYGFFRRKKREELIKVKQRLSMNPNSYDNNAIETEI